MKNSFLKLSLVAAVVVTSSMTSLAAADIVSTTNGTAPAAKTDDKAQMKHLFANEAVNDDAVDYAQAKKFTTDEVETAVKETSKESLDLLNKVKDTLVMKKNPVDGKVSTDDKDIVSSMSHVRANVAEINALLGVDKNAFSEKDRHAITELEDAKTALETKVTALETKIQNVDNKIPTAAPGINLGSITIPVLGTSKLQVFPIMEDGQMIGSVRTRCGAYLKEDQLINNKSVNYCVATVWNNSATRVSDVHPEKTTDTYFTGRSESYVPGEVSTVTIQWDTTAKVSVDGFLKYHNITDANSLKTLSYDNTVIAGDGHKYAGKDAAVE